MNTFKTFVESLIRKPRSVKSGHLRPENIAAMATHVDKELDRKYGYGTVKGGVHHDHAENIKRGFGAVANYHSAHAAISSILAGHDREKTSHHIHQGWAKAVSQVPHSDPGKQSKRMTLAKTKYKNLSEEEKDKDREIHDIVRKRMLGK